MQLFIVTIGQRNQPPRLAFEVQAEDSMTAAARHIDLALPNERVEVIPLRSVAERITARTRAAWIGEVA